MHIGGNETTQYALTAEARLLAERPELFEELKADRSKVRYFVEEALRLYAPTQGLSTRLVAEDTEIRGVKIPRGSLLHLRYGAGTGMGTSSSARRNSTSTGCIPGATSRSRRARARVPGRDYRGWSRTSR